MADFYQMHSCINKVWLQVSLGLKHQLPVIKAARNNWGSDASVTRDLLNWPLIGSNQMRSIFKWTFNDLNASVTVSISPMNNN